MSREDARRRLGSDLHDGLGHRLAGLLRSTERISGLVVADPPVAKLALDELTQHTRAAIHEVRELAHQLHPPELELFGLVGALREQAERYASPTVGGLRVSVEAPSELASLPACGRERGVFNRVRGAHECRAPLGCQPVLCPGKPGAANGGG